MRGQSPAAMVSCRVPSCDTEAISASCSSALSTSANVWMRLTYPKNASTAVLPRDVVHIQGMGLALSPGT